MPADFERIGVEDFDDPNATIVVSIHEAKAIDRALAGRERLLDIIDRAAEQLPDGRMLDRLERIVSGLNSRTALDLAEAIDGIKAVRAILAEVEPEDLEAGGREGEDGSEVSLPS